MGKGDKQHYRPKYNNHNPYNKLQLNKFHQIGAKAHNTDSKLLHKKKRDLERAIRFKEQKNEEIDQQKLEQLQSIKEKLEGNKKEYEKKMRKQFFLKSKYKQIMEIQMRKIQKKLGALRQSQRTEQVKQQLLEWQKKQRYIKFFPKNLKYVSLFPSAKPLEEGAIQFQQKIMDDIEKEYRKRLQKKNAYKPEVKSQVKKSKKKTDNFFIVEQEEEVEQQADEE